MNEKSFQKVNTLLEAQPQLPAEMMNSTETNHQQPVLLGVDYSQRKHQAWALVNIKTEMIERTHLSKGVLDLFINIRTLNIAALAFEKAYLGKNAAAALSLSSISGKLELLCEILQVTPIILLGEIWQYPIKRALGVKRAPGMSDYDYKKYRYQKYRQYIKPHLEEIDIDTLNDDQVAACAIGLHGVKLFKKNLLKKRLSEELAQFKRRKFLN